MLFPLSTTFLCPHIIPYFFLSVIAFRTKAAEGEKSFLGLQLEGMVHHGRVHQGSRGVWQLQEAERRMLMLSSLSPFYSVHDPGPRDAGAHIQRRSSLPQLSLLGIPSHMQKCISMMILNPLKF